MNRILLAALPVLGLALTVSAAPFLMVDLNGRASFGSGAAGPTETGFTGIDIPAISGAPATLTQTIGAVTVTLSAPGLATATNVVTGRDRGTPAADSGALTYAQLYRDFAFNNPGNAGAKFDLQLSGLSPNTAYDIRLFSWDGNNSNETTDSTVTWSVLTGTGTAGSISFRRNGVGPTSDFQYSTLIRATTNGSGVVKFEGDRTAGTGSPVVLNGFTVEAVPEPTSLAVLGLAAVLGLRRRRA